MKAQNYQARQSKATLYAIFITIFIMCLPFADVSGMEDMSGSMFALLSSEFISMGLMIFAAIIVPSICGCDMNDKTINYELLSGHSRSQTYFGRVIVGFLWAVIGGVLITLGPILLVTVIKGWGNTIMLGDALSVYALTLVVYIRCIAELSLFTFLVRNSFAAGFLGFALFEATGIAGMVIEELFDKKLDCLFSITNMLAVSELSNSRIMVIDGEAVEVFSTAFYEGLMTDTIIVSLVMVVCCILLGYAIFKKRDMK